MEYLFLTHGFLFAANTRLRQQAESGCTPIRTCSVAPPAALMLGGGGAT
jgi:hypothetical protein